MATVEVGDFVSIPAWRIEGMVTAVRPATTGSDDAIEVFVQERPDGPERRYRLEPGQFTVVA